MDVLGKRERNYGVELARVLAMFYILILHSLRQGGIFLELGEGGGKYLSAWFLESWALPAVDIFALISGYVGYSEEKRPFAFSRYAELWLQVVFYALGLGLLYYFFSPVQVPRYDLMLLCLPVSSGQYWYFKCYTALFFLMPFLNTGIRALSRSGGRRLFALLFVLFSVYDGVVGRFGAAKGYSVLWLVVLYLMGAIVRKCGMGSRITPLKGLLGTLLCILPAYAWKTFGRTFLFLNIWLSPEFLLQYNSPFVLGAALFTFLGLAGLRIPACWHKPIRFLSSGAFAAYLINCHLYVWEHFMYSLLRPAARLPLPLMLLSVLAFALLFLLGSILVDHVRQLLFRLLRVRSRAQALADKLCALFPASFRND